jgi:RND family efflux transporter MFP subunit
MTRVFRSAISLPVLVALVSMPPPVGATPDGVLDCLIEPEQVVTVSMPVEGVVETVTVDRGDLIVAGQVLATLESDVEKATLELARARAEMDARVKNNEVLVKYSTRRYRRSHDLFSKEIISLHDLDESEGAKLSAEMSLREARDDQQLAGLELARAQAVLDRRTVRSPVTGVVVDRFLSPGEFASEAEPQVLEVAQIDPLRVEVFAPMAMLGRVTIGMEAQVELESPIDGRYGARVTVVDPVVDAASATFGVRLELANPDHLIPAGVKCRVQFRGQLAKDDAQAPARTAAVARAVAPSEEVLSQAVEPVLAVQIDAGGS